MKISLPFLLTVLLPLCIFVGCGRAQTFVGTHDPGVSSAPATADLRLQAQTPGADPETDLLSTLHPYALLTAGAENAVNPFCAYWRADPDGSDGRADADAAAVEGPIRDMYPAPPPVDVRLDVVPIKQYPELPNGCEVTSLAMAMNYQGYAADKCDLSDNYLPKSDTWKADPEYEYLGEPRRYGYYCFASCLCTAVDRYNAACGTDVLYRDLTGTDASELYVQIDHDDPVIVWGTLGWYAPSKDVTGLYCNLHCVVLCGYTATTVTVADPVFGNTVLDRARFERVWMQMGSRAIVIGKSL